MITAPEIKKEEVISTTKLIRDGKIAIKLVLIKLHYFLYYHQIILLLLPADPERSIHYNGTLL